MMLPCEHGVHLLSTKTFVDMEKGCGFCSLACLKGKNLTEMSGIVDFKAVYCSQKYGQV